jgi:hypothetical protein
VRVVPDLPSRLIADRYRLIGEVGRGGTGRVWAARDEVVSRATAGGEPQRPVWNAVPAPASAPVSLLPTISVAAKPSAPAAPVPSSRPPTKPASARPASAKPTTAAASAGKSFVNMQTGNCLDVPDGSDTADIQMWDCYANDNQRFTAASDGTLRVLGKCLQIRGTGNGAHLGIATCTGAAAQRFRYNSAFDLVSVQVDKCVDVPDGNAGNGVEVQIWDCNGTGNQKWQF